MLGRRLLAERFVRPEREAALAGTSRADFALSLCVSANNRSRWMMRPSLLVGAFVATVFTAGDLQAMRSDSPASKTTSGGAMLLAQDGGAGGGGGGDAMGRGADTSKGAVPKDQGYPSGQYPSGIESRGTAPAPGAPAAGSSAAPTTPPGTQGSGAPGTGLGSPGTTQKGGTTRTDR
jgi:hypothetical protein